VDGNTRILSYSYDADNDVLNIEIESDRYQRVVISDVGGPIAGSGVTNIPQKRVQLSRGTQTVQMPVEEINGDAAVSIATNRNAVYLSTGASAGNLPSEEIGGTTGLLTGTAVAVGTAGVAAYRRKHREYDDVEEVQ
jgi:hypothetical protein